MANQSSIFPIFLRAEYREDANGVPKFISSIKQAAQISEAEMKRVGAALNNALSAPRTGSGSLDLGTAQLRELIKQQQAAEVAARDIANATKQVAIANSDMARSLVPIIRANFKLADAKKEQIAQSRAQLAALQAVEAELQKGTRAVQARLQAEQNLANFRKTVNLNEGALRAAAGQASIDRAALSGATLQGVLGRVNNTSNPIVEQQRAQQAAAAQAAAKAQDALAASAARLTAQIDPMVAAQQRYDATLAEANRLLQAGAITTQQFAQAQAFASTQLRETARSLIGVAEAEQRRAQQQREAQAAQQALAASAAQLRAQLDPMFAAQQRFDQELARADDLLRAGAISTREYAAAQQLARDNLRQAAQAAAGTAETIERVRKVGTTATQNVINSQRASRTAFIQLGQQMQDVAVQAQMGTNAFLIFGQQAPQAAFALSGLADSTNKTQAAIGRFATFMSGPFGALIFVGVAALGPLVAKLFETGDEADKARTKAFNFADGLDVLALSAEDATAAMDQLSNSMRRAIALQGDFLRGEIAIARQSAETLQAQILADQAELGRLKQQFSGPGANLLPSLFGPSGRDLRRQQQLEQRIAANRASLGPALEAAGVAAVAEANRNIAEAADPLLRQINAIDEAIARLNRRREQTVIRNDPLADNNVTQADFERELADLARRRAALEQQQRDTRRSGSSRGGGSGRTPRDTSAREEAVEARFAQQTAEQVQRINERFQQQGRLVQQSAQATRQLDLIIADVNRRMAVLANDLTPKQREEFQKIVREAEQAKGVIKQAFLLPVQEAELESQRRVQIQTLITQGRVDEAAALQATFQLEQQLGAEVVLRKQIQNQILAGNKEDAAALQQKLDDLIEQKGILTDIVLLEQAQIRELQRKQALMEAQANVVRTVAGDLRSILSGRSTDFFGNFQQAIRDLQGARLFEKLFGPAFQALEQELAGNTPQGRANQAYVRAVNETSGTTTRLERSLGRLADATDNASARIAGGVPANDNLPTAGSPWAMVRMAALGAAGIGGGIEVLGSRGRELELAQKSTQEIAEENAKATVKPLVDGLGRIVGREIAGAVGNIAAGALAGYARGGTVGGILGAGKGLVDSFADKDGKLSKAMQGLSDTLGTALKGAETGTQVAGLANLVGLPSNSTGAQIGGSIGALTKIPGADIVGAVIGNFLGALIAGIPKGSATIDGSSVLGVVGNRSSLRDAAGSLGGAVNDVVANVARQLGGRVGTASSPVSIGMREEDFRVDLTGRGTTRVAGGAIDFGKDQEAAVRFAAQTLIERGVIAGIRDSEQRLLKAGKSLEDGIRDVLDFRGVFDRLREIRDPVGFAVDRLNREFERLIELFDRAGASAEDFTQLRDLYDIERARAIEDANSRIIGSLRQLLNDLRIGDSGLSLRSRRANALGQFEGLAARVAAGDSTAFDDFADISKQLLDIERQLFGSTQSYFDRLAQITALTEKAVADQTNVTSIATAQGSPFPERAELNRSIDVMNADVSGWLRTINGNLIALDQSRSVGGGGGSSVSPFEGDTSGTFFLSPIMIANF